MVETTNGAFECTNSLDGKAIKRNLNLLYSISQGDRTYSQTYNWCDCEEKLSTGAIVGIVIASIVAFVWIAGGFVYIWARRQ